MPSMSKPIIGLLWFLLLLTLLCSGIEMSQPLNQQTMNFFSAFITSVKQMQTVNPEGSTNVFITIVSDLKIIPGIAWNFITAIFNALIWNYSFMNNGGFWGRIIQLFCYAMTAGFAISLYVTFRGGSTVP